MKKIIITFSNGDIEEFSLAKYYASRMMKETVDSEFKIAWTNPDEYGDYKRILNMQHVRSIEIVGDEEIHVD